MNKKYLRSSGKLWTDEELKTLRTLAVENTPTRVIGLKLGRSVYSVRKKAAQESISLLPVNQSPYNRRAS